MQRVDFYLLGDVSQASRLQFCCQLVEKQHRQNPIDCVIVDNVLLNNFSDMLWQHNPSSFIAHQLGISEHKQTINLITHEQLITTPQRMLYLSDQQQITEKMSTAGHIFEVITNEPAILSASRMRYRTYKNTGFEVKMHEMLK